MCVCVCVCVHVCCDVPPGAFSHVMKMVIHTHTLPASAVSGSSACVTDVRPQDSLKINVNFINKLHI